MSALSDIQDLYNKVNANTVAVAELRSELHTTNVQNSALIDLLVMQNRGQNKIFKLVAAGLFIVDLFLSGIIGYGAIGSKGMYTVRDTTPITTWHNDLDGWHSDAGQNKTTK